MAIPNLTVLSGWHLILKCKRIVMRYFYLIRVHHWVKNFFIFIPAFFAGTIFQYSKAELLTQGFICFCLASSAVYILNDCLDISSDRLHPVKKNRPLASGKVSVAFGLTLMTILFVACIGWSYLLSVKFLTMILLY